MLMQIIFSTIYQHTHAMTKAFAHFDDSGEGWLSKADFEEALTLVLTEYHQQQLLLREQVHELVESLLGSKIADGADRIDYNAFIQALDVVDTSIDPSIEEGGVQQGERETSAPPAEAKPQVAKPPEAKPAPPPRLTNEGSSLHSSSL